jgi:hypothetical protein
VDTINLGDVARDNITGFQGVAIAKTKWLHGCTRLTLQPESTEKDGKPTEQATFDEPQLKLIKRAKHPGTADKGGPRPEPVRQSSPR